MGRGSSKASGGTDIPIVGSILGNRIGTKNISAKTAARLFDEPEATEITVGFIHPKTKKFVKEGSMNKYHGEWVGNADLYGADLSNKKSFVKAIKGKTVKVRQMFK